MNERMNRDECVDTQTTSTHTSYTTHTHTQQHRFHTLSYLHSSYTVYTNVRIQLTPSSYHSEECLHYPYGFVTRVFVIYHEYNAFQDCCVLAC